MKNELNLDFDEVKSLIVNQDVVKFIERIEAHYEAKFDDISNVIEYSKKADVLKINDMEIDDPDQIKGIRIGLILAKSLIGDFPVKTKEPVDDEDE